MPTELPDEKRDEPSGRSLGVGRCFACVTEPGPTTGSGVFLQTVNPSVNKPILMHRLILALGWPRLKWVVTDSKYLSKSPKDWQPNISAAGTEPAYIEVSSERGVGSGFRELN